MATDAKTLNRTLAFKGVPEVMVVGAKMLSAPQSKEVEKERSDGRDVSAHQHRSSLSSIMPPARVSIVESVSSASSIASEASENFPTKGQGSPAVTFVHLPTNPLQDSSSKLSSEESPRRTANLASTDNRKRLFQDMKDLTSASSATDIVSDDSHHPIVGQRYTQQQQRPDTAAQSHTGTTDSVVGESASKRLRTPLPESLLETLMKQQQSIVEPNTTVLLAHPHDEKVLNPLHVFVRQQVEVFAATQIDLSQPAPGRKNPILLNQIGLRCIHCKDLRPRDRVKRAVCFPTSVGRVYHSVSDMKFDHFSRCKGLSADLRAQLEELKANSKQKKQKSDKSKSGSFSSTAQYYHDSARKMGMIDANGGVFLTCKLPPATGQHLGSGFPLSNNSNKVPIVVLPLLIQTCGQTLRLPDAFLQTASSLSQSSHLSSLLPALYGQQQQSLPLQILHPSLSSQASSAGCANRDSSTIVQASFPDCNQENQVETKISPVELPAMIPSGKNSSSLLASPLDAEHLNEIHCFVRKHVQVFEATREDLAAPAPGRRNRIVLGQVGIRCFHCKQHNRVRVKRSICYPPSIHGIYHAVSNMKFDHFGICKSLPAEARAEFTRLRNGSAPRNKSSQRKTKSSANSMAKYYVESAKLLGLVDAEDGIRFQSSLLRSDGNGPESPPSDASHVSDGMSALMLAATDPQLRAAYDHKKLQKKKQLQQECV